MTTTQDIDAWQILCQAADIAEQNRQPVTMIATRMLVEALEQQAIRLHDYELTLNAIDGIILYDDPNRRWRVVQHWVRKTLGRECFSCPVCAGDGQHPSRQSIVGRQRIALLGWVQAHTIDRSRLPESEWPQHAHRRRIVSDNEAVEELLDVIREA